MRRRPPLLTNELSNDDVVAGLVVLGSMALTPFTVVANWTSGRIALAQTASLPGIGNRLAPVPDGR